MAGGDAGTQIDGILANKSPAAISMAADFANDEAFAGVEPGLRYKTVQAAIDYVEADMNPTQARTRALQEFNAAR
jgi:hypothetical protein